MTPTTIAIGAMCTRCGRPNIEHAGGLCPQQQTGSLLEWLHLKPYGYAPGGYMARCHRCSGRMTDVDKRAITCRPCAERLHTEAAAIAGAEVPAASKALDEKVIAQLEDKIEAAKGYLALYKTKCPVCRPLIHRTGSVNVKDFGVVERGRAGFCSVCDRCVYSDES